MYVCVLCEMCVYVGLIQVGMCVCGNAIQNVYYGGVKKKRRYHRCVYAYMHVGMIRLKSLLQKKKTRCPYRDVMCVYGSRHMC